MRIYNGTNSQLDLPLSGTQRISVPPRSVSGDIMPSNEFLSLLVSSFDYSEIALIVSGPYEINMCAGVSGSVGFVAQSLDEAIERFAEKEDVIPVAEVNENTEEKIVAETKPVVEEENEPVCIGCVEGIIEEEDEKKPVIEEIPAKTKKAKKK